MDDINLNFIDDEFEFKKVNIDSLLNLDDKNEEPSEKETNIEEKTIEVTEPKKNDNKPKKNKKNNDLEINNDELSNDDILDDIYTTLEGYSKLVEKSNEKNKELELLKFEYQKIKDENEYLNKKYKNVDEEKISLDIELKRVKKDLAEKEKKVLMLKTLLQIIIKEYGNEEITKVTKLNMDQLKKFLN